jgi:hypothetical protein
MDDMITGTIIKKENAWTVRVQYLDGTEDYDFPTQTAARYWADRASITIVDRKDEPHDN